MKNKLKTVFERFSNTLILSEGPQKRHLQQSIVFWNVRLIIQLVVRSTTYKDPGRRITILNLIKILISAPIGSIRPFMQISKTFIMTDKATFS